MSEAPERIWAIPSLGGDWGDGLGMWWPEDTRLDPQAEYIRKDVSDAAIAKARAEAVKVKPLVWGKDFGREAQTPWGSYAITDRAGPNGDWDYFGWYFTSRGDWDHSEFQYTTIEAAKSAAQADYESRILAAIGGAA